MGKIPSWKASSVSAFQEIPRISWNLMVHQCVYNSPSLVPIHSHITPVDAQTLFLEKTGFSCCCRTSKQPACLEHLGWIFQLIHDFENISAFHARASNLATYQPSFVLFCSQIRGHCRSAVWMGYRTHKRLADRPLPRRFVVFSWSPNSLWSFPLTATKRLSHHGISSHVTTRCGCLKTTTTRNFAL